MSMLPIDIGITVQRTVDLNRTHAGEATARPELAQDQFAERFNKEVRQQEQQVNQTNKSEEKNVNPDGKGNSGYAERRRKNIKEKKTNDSQPEKTGNSGSMFDVSI